ncbi:prolyl oligopeptidase family serine peptidase [Siccirubricoccus sp. KC 17139]|uniref:Prolyl oligopeptidase family serine peptidase n=1 Tax=Siccirubricoccus soli TaxID=2899147 RepID=A0ABT1D592_9PROT|nr:prolyl oligopeptidase family serine peptidase [Siccirubricoccus soli]MCO6417088.1 prolyl oligopeptidase family serine peptidase [Siccirubricoccus soli]MCP2683223.1 prolyl oligopeptidase family serine peptidase [Siccirubricoccus soli]
MATLDGPRLGPRAGGAAQQLVVLLHGLGADGTDLIGLAPEWAEALPHAAFVAPDAPSPCDMGPWGRQWFSLQDRSPARMAAEIRAVAPALQGFLDAELARLGLPGSALALAGFSQGCMMALFCGLRRATAPAAILGYSGALLASESLAEELACRPPVLLVHGEADEVVPVEATRSAAATLTAAGVAVETLYRPGLAHGIDPAGIAAGAAALRRAFGVTPG